MMYFSFALILFLFILSIMYFIKKIHKISFIYNIKNKVLSWGLSFIPLIIFALFLFIDGVNTFIVYLHIISFCLIFDFVFWIIKKVLKRNYKYNISLLLSIICTFIYLLYGYYLAHHVVQTNYVVSTNKDIEDLRIVQISDSHVGATMDGNDFIKYMDRVNDTNPDVVVVTGDFVDDDTSLDDMIKSCKGLGNLKTKYGVYFVYGNHDKGYYNYRKFNNDDLVEELNKNNVVILEDELYEINDDIVLVGRQDTQVTNRAKISDLVSDIDKDKYIIVLDHEPNDYKNEAEANVDLVLSGHTHGGQLIPLGPIGVLMGFNDAYYGLEKRDNTTFIVNSGIGDWAIKFKTGTISEYGVIDIKNK